MISTTLFWIGIFLLGIILVIATIGINHAKKDALSSERVVCAGSVDNSYPATVKIKLPKDPIQSYNGISQEEIRSLSRYVVKGNSMQYASINSNDIIYVRNTDVDTIRHNLPKVTLLKFEPKSKEKADRKIRRTWSVVDSDISDESFGEVLRSVLNSEQFRELRSTMADRCPSDDNLKTIAFDRLHKYQQTHALDNAEPQKEELLLSSTFRTERDCLEFSIHPSSSLQGIVACVSHPLGDNSHE